LKNNNKKIYLLALVPFFILILMFEIVPIINIIGLAFMPEGKVAFTLEHFQNIFKKKLYLQSISNSLIISFSSALVGIIIALFGAKAANEARLRTKTIFMSILSMTSNFAGVPLAFAYIILLGNVGVLVMIGKSLGIGILAEFNLYSVVGLSLIYVYFQIPLALLLLIPAFEGIRKEWIESVSLFGGTNWYFWRKVGIPVLLPSIFGTFSVLFANSMAAYATAYALLQNNFSMLPIRITEQFVGDIVQRKGFGSALALIMMLLMIAAIMINDMLLKKSGGQLPNEK
jgi:putative spermidine/putrescine transport system permease protein